MSAHVVSERTVNLILAGLSDATGRRGMFSLPTPPEELRFEWEAESGRADATRVGRMLLKMNVDAVAQRYGEQPSTELLFAFQAATVPTTVWAFLKALCCYRYQCSEGDVTGYPLFRAVDDYCGRVAEHIVRQTDEWENAEGWG